MKDILIAGIAGSWKGTQARQLEEKLGDLLQYFEPGSVLRALSSNDNIVGNYAKEYTSNGRLLPDNFMRSILWLVLASLHKGNRLLIDGFPRMVSQKKIFDEVMEEIQRDFIVFHLVISEDEAINRLMGRLICPTCGTTYNTRLHGDISLCPHDNAALQRRADDQSVDAIQERLQAFHRDTKPLLDEYKKQGKLIEIDGTQSIEMISKEIMAYL